MNKTSKTNKRARGKVAAFALLVLIGAVFGFGAGILLGEHMENNGGSPAEILFDLGVLCVGFFGLYLVQTVLHEAGHLVFGLLSGYRFSSFRIGSLMLVKTRGKLRLRWLRIAGTGGQCLMAPPRMENGKIPVVLYNLGGSLFNLLSVPLFLAGYFLAGGDSPLGAFCLLGAIIGFLLAALNGIPVGDGLIDNDGRNALSLRESPVAMRSFWLQLEVNAQITEGVRLKDMPEEWFALPSDEQMQNAVVAATGVFACNRLMDAHRFADADPLMEHFLSIDSKMAGVHRYLMLCDRIYCLLTEQVAVEDAKALYTKELQAFMNSMKNFPTVLRTQYVYALLAQCDLAMAEKIRLRFEKAAKRYPYPNDIESERELMQIADLQKGVLS